MNTYNLIPFSLYDKSFKLDLSYDSPIWWLKILIIFCVLLSYYYMTIDHFKENYLKKSKSKIEDKNNINKTYKNKKKNKFKKLNKNKKKFIKK